MLKKLTLTALAISLILTLAGCATQNAQELRLKTTTQQIQQAIQTELNNLDADMSDAAAELSRTGLSGEEARNILNGLAAKYPFIIDTCTADPTGKMVTVAPETYSSYEGTYIGTENVTAPALTSMFTAVEGMDAVAVLWPIFSDKGDFMGTMSALFKPERFLYGESDPFIRGTTISLDVMQLDGLDIYNSKGVDTGINLFTDPEFQQYTDLIELGHQWSAQESGSGSYTIHAYETGELVTKLAYWETVKLHDTAWRVVCEETAESH